MAGIKKQARFARAALVWALVYPLVGSIQRDRAITAGWELAMSRGHQPVRRKPSQALAISCFGKQSRNRSLLLC